MGDSFAAGLVGIVLDGRYRLDALIGEGGMGAVFRATHLAMDRKVAVKLLKPHLTSDELSQERFVREARSTLKVDSPHAVKVLDFGITPHRDYYMALEYLDGRTVQKELEVDGPFSPARAVHVILQALHALGAAHRAGLVHRDIKPDNILLLRVGDDPDYTKVLDFGVAKLMEGAASSARSQLALTQVGMVFGTPEFMSPEQACGHALDARSDLYSLATTLFVMLTGRALFQAKAPIDCLIDHVRTPPPHLADVAPSLAAHPELDAILQRCLAKQRDQRPRSAEEMAQLLAALQLEDRQSASIAAAPTGPTPAAVSSFLAALPSDELDPGAPLAFAETGVSAPAPALASTVAQPAMGSTSEVIAALPDRRRPVAFVIGALAILGVVIAALVVASARRGAPPASGSTKVVVTPDAATTVDDAAIVAEVVADAAMVREVVVDAAVAAPVRPPRRSPAEPHVKNAEEALRARNNLRQLAEADLALRADPRHARAKYLLADALIKSGDIDRGCRYLRQLARNPQATARAKAASCPGD